MKCLIYLEKRERIQGKTENLIVPKMELTTKKIGVKLINKIYMKPDGKL